MAAPPPVSQAPTGAYARTALPPMRLFGAAHVAPAARANADMVQDFLDLSFRLETGRPLDGFSRFQGPVSIAMAGAVPATAGRDLDALIGRLRAEAGLDVRRVPEGSAAAITVEFVPERAFHRTTTDAACFAAPRVRSWSDYRRAGPATLDWTTYQTRERVAIFIPTGVAPQEVRDCLNEELAQALGPLNDLYRLPDSVFNDDNVQSILTGFDMLMLRATYAPELQPGMSRDAVAAALPALLARLNPAGQRPGRPLPPTPRAFGDAIADALGRQAAGGGRLQAALRALAIAEPWQDHRTGFALVTVGRLRPAGQRAEAVADFTRAAGLFEAAGLPLHRAGADLQLALMALAAGDWHQAMALADQALPAATVAQNATLMADLMMVKATALDRAGDSGAAARVRLDSLGWARYGMASDSAARRRLQLIAELSARKDAFPS